MKSSREAIERSTQGWLARLRNENAVAYEMLQGWQAGQLSASIAAAMRYDARDRPTWRGGGRVPYSRATILLDYFRRVPRRRFWQVSVVATAMVPALVLFGHAALSSLPAAVGPHLRLAVPAYVFPGDPPLVTLQTMSPAPRIVILNPNNGDAAFSAEWQNQADRLLARGITVLGYVHTDGGTRPVADVEASINNYLQSSPGVLHVSGIFLDEMSSGCSAVPYYANLYRYIRQIDPVAFVAANPGAAVNACFLRPGTRVAQTFVTFEHDASTYISGYQGNVVQANGRITSGRQYPVSEFWHLIYGAAGTQMQQIVALAAARHAGYAYITDASLPNPWDSVASYIGAEANAMASRRAT